jgi:glycosyltransferase involved in cell wall biosynthesis
MVYAIPWNLTEIHGWGLVGVHTALYLIDQGRTPILLDKPLLTTLRPTTREKIEPLLPAYERFVKLLEANPGKVIQFNDLDIMHALSNGLQTTTPNLRGLRNIGVVAFEDTLMDADTRKRGHEFDFIVAHSRFNCQLLSEAGFPDVRMAWQGVDPVELLLPKRANRFGDRFVVFSGGKLEFRKSQDVVVEAFRRFHARHPDSVLVGAWHNPWPENAMTMAQSKLAKVAPMLDQSTGRIALTAWATANGVPPGAFADPGFLLRAQMTQLLAEIDVAIFPSRCEGATNLVAMECMGSGIPSLIAANSGQKDLMIEDGVCYPLTHQTPMDNPDGRRTGWCDTDPDEVVEKLEQVYTDRKKARKIAAKGRDFILGQRTWRKFAEVFVAECDR